MSPISRVLAVAVGVLALQAEASLAGRQAPPRPRAVAPIERTGTNELRIGTVRVDTARKEVSVTGVITEATTLEFIAVAKDGFKAYESALELDTDAVSFNTGLILIGLDPARATVPRFHIDPTPPAGDLVDIVISWAEGGRQRTARAEDLVYNARTKTTLTQGPWVYTGSAFSADGNAYLAEIEGTLIGFVHSPAPVIDSPRALAPGDYGSNRLNPALNLTAGQSVTLTVKALPSGK